MNVIQNLTQIFQQVPTPAYVVSKELLEQNARILKQLADDTGAHVLLAQKAFSMYAFYPLLAKYLAGTAASGLYEARLAHEEMPQKENHVFSPAYTEKDFATLLKICDHIIFNSFAQWEKYKAQALAAKKSCGLRVNPEFSTQATAMYDPCAPSSRLGVRLKDFRFDALDGLEGLHMHTLCEQDAEPLAATVEAFEAKFAPALAKMQWVNLGGGHHITKSDYNLPLLRQVIRHLQSRYGVEVYLEPGEAVAYHAGFLVAEVLEIIDNEVPIAILNASAACHMPDVLEMPYRPPVRDAGLLQEKAHTYQFAGATCLAGDVIGTYSFDEPLHVGSRVVFEDMAIYTMVKTNTFNGMPLPAIVAAQGDTFEVLRSFGYEDFKSRL